MKITSKWSCPRCGQELLDEAERCPHCKLVLPSFLSEEDRQQWLEQVKETARREEEARKQEGLRRKKEEELRQQEELRKKREQEARQRVEPQKVDPSPQKNKDKTEKPSLDSQHSGKNAEKKERATPRTIAIWSVIIFFLSLLIGIGSYQYFINSKKTSDTGNEKKEYVVFDPTKSKIPENLNNNNPASNTVEAHYSTAENHYYEKDYVKAILEFQKIIEENPKHSLAPKVLYLQGLSLEKTGDHETALIKYNKLIDTYPKSKEAVSAKSKIESLRPTLNKSSECQNFLKDRPDPKDIEAWRKAADEGDAWSQYCVGVLYEHGWGVTQDYTKAVEYFRRAAELGNAKAQLELGDYYKYKVHSEAFKWYRKAAAQGNTKAQVRLGQMYEYGQGVTQDYTMAVEWIRKAADKGDAIAQRILGYMYKKGEVVTQDYTIAFDWYRKAAEQGDGAAQSALGDMYEEGRGVPMNQDEAIRWFQQAVNQGYVYAQPDLEKYENNSEKIAFNEVYKYTKFKNSEFGYRSITTKFNGISNTFKDNGDGTISDISTGLMWTQKAFTKGFTHYEAIKFCNNLTFAGYQDWRLPTLKELSTLLKKEKNSKDVYMDDVFSGYSWSWAINNRNDLDSWYVDFSRDDIMYAPYDRSGFVRPVRTEINSKKPKD